MVPHPPELPSRPGGVPPRPAGESRDSGTDLQATGHAEAGTNPGEAPARELAEAWSRMTFTVLPERYALIGFEGAPTAGDLQALEATPSQLVRETGESTLLVPEPMLAPILARHPGARVERDLAWVRFDAPMAWDVVGFLARVSGELARAGVPIGAVCGFDRDHLFIAARHLPKVRTALSALFPERPGLEAGPRDSRASPTDGARDPRHDPRPRT